MRRKYAEYLLEKTRKDYDDIAEKFSRRREAIWEEMKFLFEDYIVPGDRVLDLGCGNGRFLSAFEGKSVSYFGVDFSKKLIKIARQRYQASNVKCRILVSDALNLPFTNSYFDKVYAIAVLHHIPSKQFRLRFLDEAKRVLKPGGLLVLTVWDIWPKFFSHSAIYKFILRKFFGFSKLDFGDVLMPWHGIAQCYFHCFRQRELEGLVKRSGFKIKRSGKIVVSKEKKSNSNLFIVAEK